MVNRFFKILIIPRCKRGALTDEKESLGTSVVPHLYTKFGLHSLHPQGCTSESSFLWAEGIYSWSLLIVQSSEGTSTLFPAQISSTFI